MEESPKTHEEAEDASNYSQEGQEEEGFETGKEVRLNGILSKRGEESIMVSIRVVEEERVGAAEFGVEDSNGEPFRPMEPTKEHQIIPQGLLRISEECNSSTKT